MTRIRNDLFNPSHGLDRGRSKWVEAIWYLTKCLLFLTPLPFPSSLKRRVLRWFGARIGRGVVIKPRVNIHFPWKLAIGDHAWIGEETFILNFEPVSIGAHCCISQRTFLCTGNHDYRHPTMPYCNEPIVIEDGAWIGAQTFVAPGVVVGTEAMVTAGSVVIDDLPAYMVCTGNPCAAHKKRWRQSLTIATPALVDVAAVLGPRQAPENLFPPIRVTPERAPEVPAGLEPDYRRILGLRFFIGDALKAVEIGASGGLVVVPAAPALLELGRDSGYRQALAEADLVIADSGFLVMLWNFIMSDRIHRVSGVEYLKLLLQRPEFAEQGTALLVMPSEASLERNLHWLWEQGLAIQREDCYVAPKYGSGAVVDEALARLVNERKPRHVIIGLPGAVQEKLGLYLKVSAQGRLGIHCIGAAMGSLSGEQVRIPHWADEWILRRLFRCAQDPGSFVPRYAKALQLPMVLWRYRSRMPDFRVES